MPGGKLETRQKILDATWRLMEARPNETVNMGDIAKAAGISRQALYLHFDTRTRLMLATVQYVDEVKGLNERVRRFESAGSGIELLESCVEVWGEYIPEIYGLARALRNTRDSDEATAAAWNGSMSCVRDLCTHTIATLEKEDLLNDDWSRHEAVELMWLMISIQSWEQLVHESKFTTLQFIQITQKILKKTLLKPDALAGDQPPERKSGKKPAQKNTKKTAKKTPKKSAKPSTGPSGKKAVQQLAKKSLKRL
ncbi:MAG: TetR/AcrR family transcriptional regulator [Leptospirales bacterium]|jgi:AcrR family transcriptional regulator